MKNLYSQADAQAAIAKYGAAGWNEDIALKTYTTRLIGQVPELVLHGGGNSSVKTRLKDTLGEEVDVLCVKGSGWDMGSIEPPGLPAVRLAPLRKLTKLARLTDEDMVNFQRLNLLDSNAPNPSVETLFHAFLPAKFIDHTHANAVLGVSDHANGMDLLREVYGARAPVVDYVMPGFDLAKRAGEVAAAHPKADGLVLHNHGIFAWGATAQESYDRMIELVSLAEAKLAHAGRKVFAASKLPTRLASAAEIAPLIRGVLALPAGEGRFKRFVLDLRASPTVLNFVNGADANRYARAGVITPDHVIRTKGKPMVVAAPAAGALDVFAENLRAARAAYDAEYRAYFETHNARVGGIKKILDTSPRVVLVPGIGAFCAGATAKDAKIAGDLIENAAATIADAEALGPFESVSEADLFDVEYWSLEQAKLGKAAEKRLQRHVALVTGGASGIGRACVEALLAHGAAVIALDIDSTIESMHARPDFFGIACDITRPVRVRAALERALCRFGGLDMLVLNAGMFPGGTPIRQQRADEWRRVMSVNLDANQALMQACHPLLQFSPRHGRVVVVGSKNVRAPGLGASAYSASKAGLTQLARVAALEWAADGIRVNVVHPDAVFDTDLWTENVLKARAEHYGISVEQYRTRNLLRTEVRSRDVAAMVCAMCSDVFGRTTGAQIPVDGGNDRVI